ncbi:MAG: hypothetical protein O3C45_03975 [Bacteroidetes bacterium]|nr:hypothetical protein [Bacteroidota bacterium]
MEVGRVYGAGHTLRKSSRQEYMALHAAFTRRAALVLLADRLRLPPVGVRGVHGQQGLSQTLKDIPGEAL